MIKINGLSKSYGNNEVLKNISMEFQKEKLMELLRERSRKNYFVSMHSRFRKL
jgi:ABC-type enterochelin transport system ATPase subunit